MSVCLYVSDAITFESPDIHSSRLVCGYIFREYGSSSYMRVIGSTSRSQEQKSVTLPISAM